MIEKHIEEFLKMHRQQLQDYKRSASREAARIYN